MCESDEKYCGLQRGQLRRRNASKGYDFQFRLLLPQKYGSEKEEEIISRIMVNYLDRQCPLAHIPFSQTHIHKIYVVLFESVTFTAISHLLIPYPIMPWI